MSNAHHTMVQRIFSPIPSPIPPLQLSADGLPILRVATASPVRGLAGSIAHALREHERIVLRAIGAGAVNQAVKAAALARTYLADEGIEIVLIPFLREAEVEGHGRSVVELVVGRG